MHTVSSATLSMGPQQIDFIVQSGEEACEAVSIKSDGEKHVMGKALFAGEGYDQRKLSQHRLTPEERGIDISFPKEFIVYGERSIAVCIDGNPGSYHGILLYKIKGEPIQVGIWMNATITGKERVSISSFAQDRVEGVSVESILYTMPFVWICILLLLLLLDWAMMRKGGN